MCRARISYRAPDPLDDGNRPAGHLEPAQVEGYGKKSISNAVDQVPRGHVSGIASAINQDTPLTRFERLRYDLRLIPITVYSESEEYRFSTR